MGYGTNNSLTSQKQSVAHFSFKSTKQPSVRSAVYLARSGSYAALMASTEPASWRVALICAKASDVWDWE